MGTKLKLSSSQREKIHEAAMEAAFEENDGREVSYTTEKLIKSAVEAAINKTEVIVTEALLG